MIDELAWGFWPEHENWNTGLWAHESEEPECSAVSTLDLLPAIQDGSVDGMSPVSESDDREMHAAVSVMNNAARTFTKAWGLLNRVRNARGYYSVVGLAVPLAIEDGGESVQKGAKMETPDEANART